MEIYHRYEGNKSQDTTLVITTPMKHVLPVVLHQTVVPCLLYKGTGWSSLLLFLRFVTALAQANMQEGSEFANTINRYSVE